MNYTITDMVSGKQQATILGGWTWNINANTKNPELAYDFCRYMCSPDTYDVLKGAGGKQSAVLTGIRRRLSAKATWTSRCWPDQFPYTMPRPGVINEKTIDEIITNAILTVVYGQSTPEQALADLAQELRDNIASNYGDI